MTFARRITNVSGVTIHKHRQASRSADPLGYYIASDSSMATADSTPTYLGRLSMMKTVEMSNSILVIEYWMRMDKMLRYCNFSSANEKQQLVIIIINQIILVRQCLANT